ncbi:MAG TPA: class I SAM-dependent methyltransferase [Desulfobulbus sp.]|nr:class I SAM-dependent methyltransferase [Desulfobulbus sp.]
MPVGVMINKTMDRADLATPGARAIIRGLDALVRELRGRGLRISSWYGCFDLSADRHERTNRGYGYRPLQDAADDALFPWFLYWQIAWVVLHGGFTREQKILDLGGSSSLFSYYLAARGYDVTTVDLREELVANADLVAREMGWKLSNHRMDIRNLCFSTRFDHITSICVFEHIPLCERIEVNRNIGLLLKDHGRFSITFDYRNPSRFSKIDSPEDVRTQFVVSSGMRVRGNEYFIDTGKNYLLDPFYSSPPCYMYKLRAILKGHHRLWDLFRTKGENDYTFGALFLEKSA